MSVSPPPLRVAFWAISAALLLMLLLTVSDPYKIRQTILMQNAANKPSQVDSSTAVVAERTTKSVDENALVATPGDAVVADVDSDLLVPRPDYPFAQTTTVSIPSDGDPSAASDSSERSERPAMPILDPGRLTRSDRHGEFVELPPPPGMGDVAGSPDPSDVFHRASKTVVNEPAEALHVLQLETDVLKLRHDLTRLTDDRNVERLQAFHDQQTELADKQQETAARLARISEQITSHAARLEALMDRLDAPNADTKSATESAASQPPTGEPELTPLESGRERFSLVIESDNVADVLERLGRWSRETATAVNVAPTSLNPTPASPPQYLAPPAHDSQAAMPQSVSVPTAPDATSGPTFAPQQPPCNCR